jgi:hypothetical protein
MQRSTNERQVEPRNLLNSASSYHFRGEGWHAHSLLVMSPMFQQRSRKKNSVPGYRTTCLQSLSFESQGSFSYIKASGF